MTDGVAIQDHSVTTEKCRLTLRQRIMFGCALNSEAVSADKIAADCGCSLSYAYKMRDTARHWLDCVDLMAATKAPLLALDAKTVKTIVILVATVCQASIQDTQEFMAMAFGISISTGKISEIRAEYGAQARGFLKGVDLSQIKIGANDEIYACGSPILTGLDLSTLYVYAFTPADSASAETWTLQMMLLKDQSLELQTSINDAGSGLMCGIKDAFPEIYIQIDVFHILYDFGKECSCVLRHIEGALTEYYRLEKVINGPKPHKKTREAYAILKESLPLMLEDYDKIEALSSWFKELLGFNGYTPGDLESLLAWLMKEFLDIAEVSKVDNLWRIKRGVKQFLPRIPNALSFVRALHSQLRRKGEELGINPDVLMLMYSLKPYSTASVEHKSLSRRINKLLKGSGHTREDLEPVLAQVLSQAHKASSMVENLNSRIRTAINDGRGMNAVMAALLQLYINTKKARRSCKAERIGTSPLERLTGDGRNLLEILGLSTTLLAA